MRPNSRYVVRSYEMTSTTSLYVMTDTINGLRTAQIRPTGMSVLEMDFSRFSRKCYEENICNLKNENTPKAKRNKA